MSVVSTQSKRAGQRPTSSLSATLEGPTSADIVSTSSRQRQSKKDEVDLYIFFKKTVQNGNKCQKNK